MTESAQSDQPESTPVVPPSPEATTFDIPEPVVAPPTFALDLGPTNIEMAVRGRVAAALRQPMLADGLEYMIAPLVMPQPNGQMIPGFALAMAIPSGMLDQSMIQVVAVLSSPWMPQDQIDGMVRAMSEGLVESRTKMLAEGISGNGVAG